MGKLVTLSGSRAEVDSRAAGQMAAEAQPPSGAVETSEGLSLAQFLNVLRRRWGFIAGCTAILTLLAGIIVFQLTPRYTAEATVLLDTRKTQVVDIQAVVSGLQSDASVVRSEVELLKSPALAAQVVQKLDLVSNKRFNPAFQPPTLWSRINPIPTAKGLLLGENAAPPKSPEEAKQLEFEAVEGKVLGALTIVNDGRSYIIKIRFEDHDPALAALIANAVADVYLADQLEVKFAANRRATDWLNQHLAELRDSVRDSDRAVQQYKEDHHLTQTQQGTVTGQQLSELNSQLILASADRAQKEANLHQAQDSLRSGGGASASQVLASPVIQQLKAQQTELRRKEAELATRYKPAHPEMINIHAQIDDLNKKMREEADNIIRSLSNDVNAAKSREESLRESLQSLQQSTGRESQEQVRLRELEREADANRVLYENFLARFKQTSTQEDMQQADARLVSQAEVPSVPTFPKKGLLTVLALIISGFIGVGGAFSLEHLDNGFRDPDQVERLTGVPHIGLVPAVPQGKKAHDMIVEQPISSYAEAIRSVRTALHFSNVDAPPKVVLVTSSIPNEGKSIFAASLARSVAKSGSRALVIDCDLRHPSQGKLFGSATSVGLLSYFRDGIAPSRLIEEDKISRLHYLPVTEGASNPQDLLGSQQMKSLLDGLRDQYELIVLDAPPVLAVSDGVVLSHLVDATLFLIRWEETPRSVAMGALKLLRAQGVGPSGFVLSRVNVRKHAKYGYGDTGYYYGRYGSYYGYNKKKSA